MGLLASQTFTTLVARHRFACLSLRKVSAGFTQGQDELLGIQIVRRLAGLQRLHDGRTGSLAHHRCRRLNANRTVHAYIARRASACHPEVLPTLGHQDAVGDAEVFALLDAPGLMVLLQVSLVRLFGAVVSVDIDRLVEYGDLVGELAAGEVILDIQFVLADDSP